MRQKLGQHFLREPSVLKKIALALRIKDNDTIFEIGPGHGELTEFLLAEAAKHKRVKIVALERDPALAESLQTRFAATNNFQIVTGDARQLIPIYFKKQRPGERKIIGNLPYYITGRLFRIIGDLKNKPERCVFLIQKEVAERITAQPPRLNLLSAFVHFWANPRILTYVPRESFFPPPAVDSAVLTLSLLPVAKNQKEYFGLIKVLFKQPRKTILNNLSYGLDITKQNTAEMLTCAGMSPSQRPGELTVPDIKSLVKIFSARSR